jgi:hypothetical protein
MRPEINVPIFLKYACRAPRWPLGTTLLARLPPNR